MSAAVSFDPTGRVHLEVLSQSAVTCFRRCMREFKHRYVDLRRSRRRSEALRFGKFFHLGLNAWWTGDTSSASERLAAALLAMRELATDKGDDAIDSFDLIKAEELMLGYTARWGDADYKTIAVEQKFDVAIINPDTGRPSKTYRLQGALDAIVEKDGKRYQIEHKTTSSDIAYGSDYWRKVSAMDSQVSTYQVAADQAGFNLDSCIYDVVRKVAIRPYKATPPESRKLTKEGFLYKTQHENDELPEQYRSRVRADIQASPEKYFARGPVVRLESDKTEHISDLWMTAWFIRESENAGRFPRSPNACERFGTVCEYFEVCSGAGNLDDDTIFYTASTPHEELAEI